MTTVSDPIKLLASANPVPPGSLSTVAAERADGLLVALRANQVVLPRLRLSRQMRRVSVVVAAVAVLATVMVATPAWALVRDVLPFAHQPTASSSVRVVFSRMHLGTPPGGLPAGMSFAVSDDIREIDQSTLDGKTETLWVAPATGRFNFCWLWLPTFGGSCGSSAQPIGYVWESVPAHSPDQPAQTTDLPPDYRGVTYLIAGYALSPAISDVVIRFSDGSTVHPRTVWVSAPINAGFFAYNVPADQQSSQNHASAIDGYDQNGKLVTEHRLP